MTSYSFVQGALKSSDFDGALKVRLELGKLNAERRLW